MCVDHLSLCRMGKKYFKQFAREIAGLYGAAQEEQQDKEAPAFKVPGPFTYVEYLKYISKPGMFASNVSSMLYDVRIFLTMLMLFALRCRQLVRSNFLDCMCRDVEVPHHCGQCKEPH